MCYEDTMYVLGTYIAIDWNLLVLTTDPFGKNCHEDGTLPAQLSVRRGLVYKKFLINKNMLLSNIDHLWVFCLSSQVYSSRLWALFQDLMWY